MKLLEALLFGSLVGILMFFGIKYFELPESTIFFGVIFYAIGLFYGGFTMRRDLLEEIDSYLKNNPPGDV